MESTELIEIFERKEIVLFVGYEFSVFAGLPTLAALYRPLARSLNARWPSNELDLTSGHLVDIALRYENRWGRNDLIRRIRSSLGASDAQSIQIHRLLASLPTNVIFTTNQDDLIERGLRRAGGQYDVIADESDIAFWNEDRVQVVKLCGDVTRPNTFVITQRDFNTFLATRSRIAERLRTVLEVKTPLFLGYSLQDPFFNQIWDNIGLDFGNLRRWGYAVTFPGDPMDVEDYRCRGIRAMPLENKGIGRSMALIQWLEKLNDALAATGNGLGSQASLEMPKTSERPRPASPGIDENELSYVREHGFDKIQPHVSPLKERLRKGDITGFMNIIKSMFAKIPYQLRIPREAYYHSLFYIILETMGVETDLEVSTDKGRIDGILELDDRIYIIEFKYGKSGSSMKSLTKRAIRQIREKKYEERFLSDPRQRYLLGVGFAGKEEIGHKVVKVRQNRRTPRT